MNFETCLLREIKEKLTPISERELEERYCEILNESGPVKIAAYEYDVSDALRKVDPTAYRCGLADFISFLLDGELCEIDDEYYRQNEVEELTENFKEEWIK